MVNNPESTATGSEAKETGGNRHQGALEKGAPYF